MVDEISYKKKEESYYTEDSCFLESEEEDREQKHPLLETIPEVSRKNEGFSEGLSSIKNLDYSGRQIADLLAVMNKAKTSIVIISTELNPTLCGYSLVEQTDGDMILHGEQPSLLISSRY